MKGSIVENPTHKVSSKLTLSEYITSNNLRLRLKSRSQSRQNKPEVSYVDVESSSIRLTRQELIDQLRLHLRQFIEKDSAFTKVNNMINRLIQLYRLEIKQTKKNNILLESMIKEQSFNNTTIFNTQRNNNDIKKTKRFQENSRIDIITSLHMNQDDQKKSQYPNNRRNSQTSSINERSEKSQQSQIRQKQNTLYSLDFNIDSLLESQISAPDINILRATRTKMRKVSNQKQPETKQTLKPTVQQFSNLQSPHCKSISFADDQILPMNSKVQSSSPSNYYVLQTPDTLKVSSENKRDNSFKRVTFGNSAIDHYEQFKSNISSKK